MTLNQLKTQALFLVSFTLSTMTNAGIPVWSFIPSELYPPSAVLFLPYESGTVEYTVINNSRRPHSLDMVLIPGITSSVSNCSSSPSCIPGAELCLPEKDSSCTLTLSINSGQLLGNVTTGPELCQHGQTKDGQSKQQCYSPANPLHITLTPVPKFETVLAVDARAIIPVTNTGTIVSLTVRNIGPNTAFGVKADLSSLTCTTSFLDITQNFSACNSIPAGQSCTLTFSSTTACLAKGGIPIVGANIANTPTTALAFSINDYLVFALSSPSSVQPQVVDAFNPYNSAIWGSGTTNPTTTKTDGETNTTNILTTLGTNASAAYDKCLNKTNGPWYLPAICQMGGAGLGAGCTNSNDNTIDNLVQLEFINLTTRYWSSTSYIAGFAWTQVWKPGPGLDSQIYLNWGGSYYAMCAKSS